MMANEGQLVAHDADRFRLRPIFERDPSILDAVRGMVSFGRLLDPREIALDFDGEVEFESLEQPDQRVRLEPAHLREGYRSRFDAWRDTLRRECRRQLVDLVEISTDTPFAAGLGAYLQKRRRMY